MTSTPGTVQRVTTCCPIPAWLLSLHRMKCACFSHLKLFSDWSHIWCWSLCVLSFRSFMVASLQLVGNAVFSLAVFKSPAMQWAFEQSSGERNTNFYHFFGVTLPKTLLQEKVSAPSTRWFGKDEEGDFALDFQPLTGEHADLGTAARTTVGTILLVSSCRLLATCTLPWEQFKEPFFKRLWGDFPWGQFLCQA